jgi:mannan endo-1,4-beta-mannosidase
VARKPKPPKPPVVVPPQPDPPATGFVTRQGTKLMLDGQPYKFSGLNVYHANGRNDCWQPPLGNADGALAAELDLIPGNAIRAWFFQGLAVRNGQRDWSAFDHTLAVARSKGRKVVVVLTGEGGCGDPGRHWSSWYASDYRMVTQPGHTASYRAWVWEIVSRYRNDPTVLMWQIGNELEIKFDPTNCGSTDTLIAFANDVATLIKSIDTNHLVCLGVVGSGQCGSSGTDYLRLHQSPAIDVCSYHIYPGAPYPSFPGDQWNGLRVRLDQSRILQKPLVVTEMGLKLSHFAGDRQARAARLATMIAEQRAEGIMGHLPWAWCPPSQTPYEDYLYTAGDPALAVLA